MYNTGKPAVKATIGNFVYVNHTLQIFIDITKINSISNTTQNKRRYKKITLKI